MNLFFRIQQAITNIIENKIAELFSEKTEPTQWTEHFRIEKFNNIIGKQNI